MSKLRKRGASPPISSGGVGVGAAALPRSSRRQPAAAFKPTICMTCHGNVRPFFNPTTGAWSFLEMDGETPHKH